MYVLIYKIKKKTDSVILWVKEVKKYASVYSDFYFLLYIEDLVSVNVFFFIVALLSSELACHNVYFISRPESYLFFSNPFM